MGQAYVAIVDLPYAAALLTTLAVALASLALSALTAYHLHGHLRDDGAKHKAVLAAIAKTNQPCARRRPDAADPGVILPQTRDSNL